MYALYVYYFWDKSLRILHKNKSHSTNNHNDNNNYDIWAMSRMNSMFLIFIPETEFGFINWLLRTMVIKINKEPKSNFI